MLQRWKRLPPFLHFFRRKTALMLGQTRLRIKNFVAYKKAPGCMFISYTTRLYVRVFDTAPYCSLWYLIFMSCKKGVINSPHNFTKLFELPYSVSRVLVPHDIVSTSITLGRRRMKVKMTLYVDSIFDSFDFKL